MWETGFSPLLQPCSFPLCGLGQVAQPLCAWALSLIRCELEAWLRTEQLPPVLRAHHPSRGPRTLPLSPPWSQCWHARPAGQARLLVPARLPLRAPGKGSPSSTICIKLGWPPGHPETGRSHCCRELLREGTRAAQGHAAGLGGWASPFPTLGLSVLLLKLRLLGQSHSPSTRLPCLGWVPAVTLGGAWRVGT